MIEQAMIFALGFFVAGLLALAIAPAFWRRALRLSTRRLEALLPLSSREIVAERDLLRAEFAVDRRKFEQHAETLKAAGAAIMIELGHRTTELAALAEQHAGLEARHAEQGAELTAARHAAADAVAQFAVAASALYSDSGLIERKDADLMRHRADLAQARALIAKQSAALAEFEAQLAIQKADLTAARGEVARLGDALAFLRLEHDADLATMRATAARLSDREETLQAAERREVELLRRRDQQIEAARAAERRLVEKIARIGAEEAAVRHDLVAAHARGDSLAEELAALRGAFAPEHAPIRLSQPDRRDAASDPAAMMAHRPNEGRAANEASADSAPSERAENAVLRQTINEIGAAIIRAASLSLEPAAPQHEGFGGEEVTRAPAAANAKATSK